VFAKTACLCIVVGTTASTSLAGEIRQYRVTFVSEWHFTTHPTAFPGGAHFTTLIGGTHNSSVRFWELGGIATEGLEAMAERGRVSPLDNEIKAAIAAGTAWSVVQAPGTAVTPATTNGTFLVNSDFPLITLTSMVAPSPDWFVGVDSLPLFENGQWRPLVSVDLFPYDAGTDSGVFFDSLDDDTQPRLPISELSGFPFTGLPRMGTMTFSLVSEPTGGALALFALAALVVGSACGRLRSDRRTGRCPTLEAPQPTGLRRSGPVVAHVPRLDLDRLPASVAETVRGHQGPHGQVGHHRPIGAFHAIAQCPREQPGPRQADRDQPQQVDRQRPARVSRAAQRSVQDHS
jgi:hypothetical protein